MCIKDLLYAQKVFIVWETTLNNVCVRVCVCVCVYVYLYMFIYPESYTSHKMTKENFFSLGRKIMNHIIILREGKND